MNNNDARVFVKAWLTDKPTANVARELGISVATLHARAKRLRDMGVDLPKRSITRSSDINVESLNQLINSK